MWLYISNFSVSVYFRQQLLSQYFCWILSMSFHVSCRGGTSHWPCAPQTKSKLGPPRLDPQCPTNLRHGHIQNQWQDPTPILPESQSETPAEMTRRSTFETFNKPKNNRTYYQKKKHQLFDSQKMLEYHGWEVFLSERDYLWGLQHVRAAGSPAVLHPVWSHNLQAYRFMPEATLLSWPLNLHVGIVGPFSVSLQVWYEWHNTTPSHSNMNSIQRNRCLVSYSWTFF